MKDLTKGNETTQLISFALPMLLGNVFQQFYNMVDSFVVGRFVGTNALAAVGTAFPVNFFMISLIMGIFMGSTVLIAQFFGAKDKEKIKAVVDTTYIFLFVAGIVMTFFGILSAKPILSLMKVPPEIMGEAVTYLRIIFAGMLPTFGYNGVSAILRGLGDSKTPLYLLIVSTVVNVVLDLVFVVVFHWGVAGVAWATVIAQTISFIGALIVLDKRVPEARFDTKGLKWNADMFRQMLRIGLPSGVQQILVSLGMMTLSGIVNSRGAATMAAYAAASRIDSLASMPAMNLSSALMSFTGQNMGAGKTERVKRGHLSAIGLSAVISIAMTLVSVFFGEQLMRIFTSDAEVIAIGSRYLVIVGSFYIAFGTMFINNGVMRGAGDVFIPMISTLLALWAVRIPCALLFSGPMGMGTDGIWWSIPAGWTIGLIFTSIYYASGRWKTKTAIRRPVGEVTEG
ncbi:MAG: MATE family efflux transporter [Rectinema sp.]